jgi:hypothetical protein
MVTLFGVVTSLEASMKRSISAVVLPVLSLVMGGFCRWRGKAAGADGRLEGGVGIFTIGLSRDTLR